jgi:TolA-binding protein
MNTGQDTTTEKSGNRSKLYFILAAVFFLLMGLFWSLDASIVYICLGSGAWFLFLGVWHYAQSQPRVSSYGYRQQEDPGKSYSRRPHQQQKSHQAQTVTPEGKKVIMMASGFIFAVFFIIVFFAIIFSDDTVGGEWSWYEQGVQFHDAGQYDSAKVYYRKAFSSDPENADALFRYGNVLMDENSYDSSIIYYDKTLRVNPDYENAQYNKGLSLYYKKNYITSRKELRELLKRNPEYVDANLVMGDNFYAQENYDSAILWYEKGYEKGARNAMLCHIMAYIYDLKNNREKAIPLYQEALYYDSTKTEVYERLGELIPADAPVYRALANRWRSTGQ